MPAILIPRRATLEGSYDLVQAFAAAMQEPEALTLDCAGTEFFDPFGVALIAALIASRRQDQNPRATSLVPPRDPEANHFVAEVGLDRFANGESTGRGTLEIRQLHALHANYTSAVTKMLVRGVPGITEENSYPIQLCLNELLQNVFEWSESPIGCVVLARWYLKTRSVKLCVVDLGIGIPAALRRSRVRELHRATDAEVLEAAVSTPRLTSRANQVGGLGLKTILDEVSTRGGRLTVLSLGAKLSWVAGRVTGRSKRPPAFRGTAILIDFRPNALVPSAREHIAVF
jgi:anti-sigma regulatory factor (Ser/Thr protein kinase)/anti-anti-sigma regulatory factor